MPIPTAPEDRNLPKGPNFLGIVIGFAVAIIVVLLAAWFILGRSGKHIFPMNTNSTPSQTRLYLPSSSAALTS